MSTSPSEPTAIEPRTNAKAEEIFLTPRVLDQGALDAITQDLKTLIADADGSGHTLRKTTQDVRGLTGVLRTALTELQSRIERAGALAPVLEHWVNEARELSVKGIDPGRVAKELERAIAGVVQSRKAEFEHAVAPTIEALRQLRKEMDRIKAGVEAALDEGSLRARIDAAMSSAADAFERDLEARADRVRRTLDAALSAYEARAQDVQGRAARAGAAVERSAAALDSIDDGTRHAESEWRTIDTKAKEAQRRLEVVGEGLAGLEGRAARLAALPGMLDRAEQALSDSRGAAARLEGLTREVERLRASLAQELLAGADAVDAIASRREPISKRVKKQVRDHTE
jgi:chromosome segregation ATPase